MNEKIDARRDMVLGAIVADAASLGLHWIYAQPRIRKVAGDTPEFLEPNRENYEGVAAYYAHGKRHAGDSSMYGEALLTALRTMHAAEQFDWQVFAEGFAEHFGYGGEYTGYIDTPTRLTLDAMRNAEHEVLERAASVAYDGPAEKKESIIGKVISNMQMTRGEALRSVVKDLIRTTGGGDAEQDLAVRVIEALEAARGFPGADDEQLPAITRVPAIVAAHPDHPELERLVEEGVRVTNNNDRAVAWALVFARLLRWTCTEGASLATLEDGIAVATKDSPEHVVAAIDRMMELRARDHKVVAMKIGPACELADAVPVALHNLLIGGTFADLARRNILACGDSCGRAIVVGSVAGALLSGDTTACIPGSWIDQTHRAAEVMEHAVRLVN